ncbi:helix-turn-helix transcriptional regulator [bacterium]|nr:helix-turn-helix transcriptional regulator [bacterium]
MLSHSIYLFLNIFFFTTGTSGIFLATLAYWKYKNPLTLHYILALKLWTLNQLVLIIFFFLNEIAGYRDPATNAILNDLSFITLATFCYALILIMYRYFNKPLPAKFRRLFLGLAIYACIPSVYPALLYRAYTEPLQLFELTKALTMYAILYHSAFFIRRQIRHIDNEDIRTIFQIIFILQMIFFPVMMYDGSQFFNRVYPFGFSTFGLFYFLINGLWLYFVSHYIYLPELKLSNDSHALNRYFETHNITAREKDVVQLLLDGLSYNEISAKLFISYETVKSHVNNIYKKSNVNGKMELAKLIKKFR